MANPPAQLNIQNLQTPDIIKNLPEFFGSSKDVHSFVKTVNPIAALLAQTPAATQPFWLLAIRNKIKGEASDRLRLHGEPETWDEIKNCLLLHFSDHRDLRTLYNQLNNLRQFGTVQKFYEEILELVTALNVKINSGEDDAATKQALIQRNLNEGLQTFMSGVRQPLKTILLSRNPNNLNDAFGIAMLMQENSIRGFQSTGNNYRNRQQTNFHYSYNQLQPNQQYLAHNQAQPIQQYLAYSPNQQNSNPQNSRVEPMEIDRSGNSRINPFRANRSNQYHQGSVNRNPYSNQNNRINHNPGNSRFLNNNSQQMNRGNVNNPNSSRIIAEELFESENFQEEASDA